MRVKATRAGWYGNRYREAGDVFEISDEVNKKTRIVVVKNQATGEEEEVERKHPRAGRLAHFSERWMTEVKDAPIPVPARPDPKNTLSGLQKGDRTEPVI